MWCIKIDKKNRYLYSGIKEYFLNVIASRNGTPYENSIPAVKWNCFYYIILDYGICGILVLVYVF